MRDNGLTVLQHDNARPHTARVTGQFLRDNGVNVMQWPSVSPDLNPIEHLCDELGRWVRAKPVQAENVRQLQDAMLQEWEQIPQNVIRRLVHSTRQRCAAAVASAGGHTRY